MKKILFALLTLFVVMPVMAKHCIPESGYGMGFDDVLSWTVNGKPYHVSCDPQDCANDHYVAVLGLASLGDKSVKNAKDYFFRCKAPTIGLDSWEQATKISNCTVDKVKNSTDLVAYLNGSVPLNAKAALVHMVNGKPSVISDNFYYTTASGTRNVCIAYKCNSGYVPTEGRNACVKDNPNELPPVKTGKCRGLSFDYDNGSKGKTQCLASMPGIDPANTNACECTCDNGVWKNCRVVQCKPGYNYVWKNGNPMACTKSFGGVVVDQTGEPLVGASLVAKSDKETYVLTDENGKFSFPTDMTTDDNLFLVQYVGCKDKEVKLTANMRIVMSCSEELNEAVVKTCADEELFEIRAKTGQYMSDKGLCVAVECIEGAEKVVKNGVEQGNCECPEGTEFKKGDKPKNSVCEKINVDIQKCNETTNAHWDEEAKECKCVEGMYLTKAENNYLCLPVLDDNIEIDDVDIELEDISVDIGDDADLSFVDPRIAQCNAKSGAKWNATTKECECADKVNTKWNSDKSACVDTDDARAARATLNISSSIATIKSLTSGLKQSAWKTEEGKFNTARLASDSIAGVVLGTAGGLITSSVVKKHQVKEGFEDIKCAIGGQNVADWGDEFNVGVK